MTLDVKLLESVFHDAAEAAAQETLPRFRVGTAIDNKWTEGFDPVTEADKMAEVAIRKVIETAFPEHGIEGEEHGLTRPDARYRWIIDPIDGTRAFISGLPVWGTLVGLYEDGIPIAGMMDQPFTGERCLALPGGSTRLKTAFHPLGDVATSTVQKIADATLMTTMPELLEGEGERPWLAVKEQAKLLRYGCDCYAYMMVACGHVDLAIEAGVQAYDVAGLIPLVRQAGGVFTTWEGDDPSRGGRVIASANATLHEAALRLLNA